MARLVKEEVIVRVSRLAKDGKPDPDAAVTPEHLQLLDEALAEIWELPPGAVVEVVKIGEPD